MNSDGWIRCMSVYGDVYVSTYIYGVRMCVYVYTYTKTYIDLRVCMDIYLSLPIDLYVLVVFLPSFFLLVLSLFFV